MEINAKCSNYRIDFTQSSESDIMVRDDLKSLLISPKHGSIMMREKRASTQILKKDMDDHSFLNVHAGVSVGIMAGMDVGYNDRWEYLIIGQPLTDVAQAESAASIGELALSPLSHRYLCGDAGDIEMENSPISSSATDKCTLMSCGCLRTSTGVFKVPTSSFDRLSTKVQSAFNNPDTTSEGIGTAFVNYEQAMNFSMTAFNYFKPTLVERYLKYCQEMSPSEDHTSNGNIHLSADYHVTHKFGKLDDEEGENLLSYFMNWVTICLVDDFSRHAHEAGRSGYDLKLPSRHNCIRDFYLESKQQRLRLYSHVTHQAPFQSTVTPASTPTSSSKATSSPTSPKTKSRVRRLSQTSIREKHERVLENDYGLDGEERNVIVMFMNIKSEHFSLSLNDLTSHGITVDNECVPTFDFLPRNKDDIEGDKKLLQHYQSCMEIVVKALQERGGHLRQFIVDDKGTVCIGTFGLRGSVAYDNAGSAIDAALVIISQLRKIGCDAAIGVTAGKAYCGIVGSLKRHEYAVMGPSTNLSARLMGKARSGEIICDSTIRMGDRTHNYNAMGEVSAKGYIEKVPIFSPIIVGFHDADEDPAISPRLMERLARPPISPRLKINVVDRPIPKYVKKRPQIQLHTDEENSVPLNAPDMGETLGRESEEAAIFEFAFKPLVHGESDYELLKSYISSSSVSSNDAVVLRTDLPTRFIVVEGPSGIGKSHILRSISRKIDYLAINHSVNICLVNGKATSFSGTNPFKSWKRIIRCILSYLGKASASSTPASATNTDTMTTPPSTDTPTTEGDSKTDSMSRVWQRVNSGLSIISQYLNDDQKALIPLLSDADIIAGLDTNEIIENLDGAYKLAKIEELLRVIIELFPIMTSSLLFIVL